MIYLLLQYQKQMQLQKLKEDKQKARSIGASKYSHSEAATIFWGHCMKLTVKSTHHWIYGFSCEMLTIPFYQITKLQFWTSKIISFKQGHLCCDVTFKSDWLGYSIPFHTYFIIRDRMWNFKILTIKIKIENWKEEWCSWCVGACGFKKAVGKATILRT